MTIRKFLAIVGITLISTLGLTSCSSSPDPSQFQIQISVGEEGSVLAGEDFEVTSSISVPEGFTEPLILSLERREVGDGWTSISETQVDETGYSLNSLDRLSEGVTAEYRLSASQLGDEGLEAFIVSEPKRVESLGGQDFLDKFFEPTLSASFPEGVSTDMLIPGDVVDFEWGFDSRVSGREIDVSLVSVDEEGLFEYDSSTTSSPSFTSNYSFETSDNIMSSVAHAFAVEIAFETTSGRYTKITDSVDFISHSIGQTIDNYLDATNQNCVIDGLTCIETLQEYADGFVANESDAWFDVYSYYFDSGDFYLYGINYQLRSIPNTLESIDTTQVMTSCHDEPYEIVPNETNRFFTFDVSVRNRAAYELTGRLHNDSSSYNFSFTPVECGLPLGLIE